MGFNKLPNLPGNENVPPPPDTVPATRQGLYMAKCEPPILDIIARARRMRINHPLLNTIYILSNGDYGYVQEARKWLESDGWDRVLISADVVNSWDDREVGEAVDTEIARRAGVFVGNGVRTFLPPNHLSLAGPDRLGCVAVLGIKQQRSTTENSRRPPYRLYAILVV